MPEKELPERRKPNGELAVGFALISTVIVFLESGGDPVQVISAMVIGGSFGLLVEGKQ